MTRKLWNRDYILLLQGSAVSCIGDMMYSVAIAYWVYQKTGSNSLMGIMSAISMFVTMFLAPFTGSIVDKCNRKWVLAGTDALQGILMLTVGALAYLDKLNVPGVLIAAFLTALGSVFYSPAANTLMIDIIPRDDMVRGESIFSGTMSLIDMVGTAFSGVMVAFFGVPLIVILNGASNLYSALTELLVHVPKTVQQGNPVSIRSVLRDSKAAAGMIFFRSVPEAVRSLRADCESAQRRSNVAGDAVLHGEGIHRGYVRLSDVGLDRRRPSGRDCAGRREAEA